MLKSGDGRGGPVVLPGTIRGAGNNSPEIGPVELDRTGGDNRLRKTGAPAIHLSSWHESSLHLAGTRKEAAGGGTKRSRGGDAEHGQSKTGRKAEHASPGGQAEGEGGDRLNKGRRPSGELDKATVVHGHVKTSGPSGKN